MNFQFDKQFIKYFENPFIVGVSGGADSMFLLYKIIQYFQDKKKDTDLITVITCNHNVRPISKSDCLFVKEFCKKNKIECFIINRNQGTNIKGNEQELRKWRHEQFLKIARRKGAKSIFLGHNLTDRFETTILNMGRGCSKSGLLGIKPIDKHFLDETFYIVRPLILFTKDQIFKYCKQSGIEYITDETNFDSLVSKRNFVRNELFPLFEKISNKKSDGTLKFWDSVLKFYSNLEDNCDFYDINYNLRPIYLIPEWNAEWGYEIVKSEKNQKKSEKVIEKNNLEYFLYNFTINDLIKIAKKLGFYKNISNKVLDEIVNFLNNSKSGYKYWNGVWFFVSHGKQYIIKKKQKNIKKRLFWENKNEGKKILLDFGFCRNNDMIRYPKVGDIFKGKTLNKYLINKKIPIFYRPWVKIYEKNGKILKVDCEF